MIADKLVNHAQVTFEEKFILLNQLPMIPSERNAQQAVASPGPPLLRNETTDADNGGAAAE